LLLAGAAVAFLVAAPSEPTNSGIPGPAPHGPGTDRVRPDDRCSRLLDAIVAADMGGDAEARRAARSALRASSCPVGRPADPR